MNHLLFRFIAGGLVVSLFAALGEVLKPKRFAGLFAAAPSVALATLGLTILTEGKSYAAVEARSMVFLLLAPVKFVKIAVHAMVFLDPCAVLPLLGFIPFVGFFAFSILVAGSLFPSLLFAFILRA
jgi:hypothetical protein